MNWWTLPESFSTFGGDIDAIFGIITWITVAIFLIVEVALIVFLWKYRHREGRRAEHVHGNLRAEVVWTAIPFVIVIFIAFQSAQVWHVARSPSQIPDDPFEVQLAAKQFEWNATYAGPDGEFETEDDHTTRNQMHLPLDRPVLVHLTAEDVIHSFFLPAFRVKQDAVPGMHQRVWFQATAPGEYVLGCAELCGLGHYRMKGSVTVHEPEAFRRWQAEQTGGTLAVADPARQEAAE